MNVQLKPRPDDQRATVLTKAVLRAAILMKITNKELAQIIGVSPSFVSNLKAGTALLAMDSKPAELAAHFIRAFRSLDAIVGGDEGTAAAWMRHANTALGAAPIDYMKSVYGLIDTVSYLDQRRAPL